MLIKLLNDDDHNLLEAAVRTFRGHEAIDNTLFLADPATIAFAALDDDAVIGWAWGTRERHVGGFSQVQLYEIEVLPDRRGQGVGRALLDRFITLASDEGHKRLWLFTDHDNTAAKTLYRSAGGDPSSHQHLTFWWDLREGRDQSSG